MAPEAPIIRWKHGGHGKTKLMRQIFTTLALAACTLYANPSRAQSQIYPQHFDLKEVRLLDGPFLNALKINDKLLLEYDADRLMTPFIRQAGLHQKQGSRYYGWVEKHPSFPNWGQSSWSLEGHIGGHYLSALALAYAATEDAGMKARLKERLDYCLAIVKDCQDAYANDATGLKGFVGGQPINQIWTGLYANDLKEFSKYGGWVPFYCEHKVLAGLRDAWLYTGNKQARDCFKNICDWAVLVVEKLSHDDMQRVLGWEHGGMNETLADAYAIFKDKRYLKAAKKYSHEVMVNGMKGEGSYNKDFLSGKHANTQVPKYIGFQRIAQQDPSAADYAAAARNFWDDVATNRTVCIGGNSINEHFLGHNNCSKYIYEADGPESCNTNNMLKLSEMLFDSTHDARYADFYEYAMWNHILSTQDPKTGGYVYFTSLRPQAYRIYSQVNQGMWCCVGTGMENHSKYGHFVYSHSGKRLYVNLFTASELNAADFALRQETNFPYEPCTKLTITKGGTYTLSVRHPKWAAQGYAIAVNGVTQDISVTKGTASYVDIKRKWRKGDVVTIQLPMELKYMECPNYKDYVAFSYGPILLAAQTSATCKEEAANTGLPYEQLHNEYGDDSRMGHSLGVRGRLKSLSSSPMLLCERSKVMDRIMPQDLKRLQFSIKVDGSDTTKAMQWQRLTLKPFYEIQHARYICYWYQQPREVLEHSDMLRADREAKAMTDRTLDFVATGEQQSEAGHDALYSTDSRKGEYRDEFYRDAQKGGYVEYTLANNSGKAQGLSLMLRFAAADRRRAMTIYVDGQRMDSFTLAEKMTATDDMGFFNIELPIDSKLLTLPDGSAPKQTIRVKLAAEGDTPLPGCFYMRLLK